MSSASLIGYARIGVQGFDADNPRAFVCTLPCWVPPWTKLQDEHGQPIGELAKVLDRTLPQGRTAVRIRLTADVLAARPSLRDDLLAHRVLLACEMAATGRRLVLASKIDLELLAEAPPASGVLYRLFAWLPAGT